MAKMTLLEMVQNILSAMDSDEVNDINDTVESAQVAEIVKETFYEQFNNIKNPSFKTLIKLNALSNVASPNYMQYNDDILNIDWIRYRNYRNHDHLETVRYITPEEFLEIVLQNPADNHFLTIDPTSGVEYYIQDNKKPDYYTSFDNNYIVFDSIDLDYETTLQQTNAVAFGTVSPTFEMENDFVPPIPDNLFPLLLAESKSTAMINLKQVSSVKEEQRARRQRIRMQNDQFKSKEQQHRATNTDRNYARNR